MRFPDTYATTPIGDLLIADGLNPMKVWNGLRDEPIDAGVLAPETACNLAAGASPGAILGDFAAYVRFLDADGNVSNLSPISPRVNIEIAGGSITAVTNTDPIAVTTSGAHGLSSGDLVRVESVLGCTAANSVWEVTVTGSTTFTLDFSSGDGEYEGGGTWTPGSGSVVYSSVPVPDSPYVTTRQILRNLDGEFETFYVDVETTDLVLTTFTSNNDDELLRTNTAVPLLSTDGSILAMGHDVPPNFFSALCHHSGRMFAAVNRIYDEGAATVTNASATVTGIGTAWTAALEGRRLFVDGASQTYLIDSVNVAAQTLTLSVVYADTTDAYAVYAIKPEEGQRRLLWYTQTGQPLSWNATYAIQVQEDGDEITGLMAKGSFLYVLEYRHIYRFTFQSDPAVDGFIYQSCQRGCINNRCWVQVEENTLMLDQDGIHAFGGGQESQPISTDVQRLFQPIDDRTSPDDFAINWAARELFHAANYPHEEVARWFVCLGGSSLPRHGLCFHYRTKRWWVEEYPHAISASALALVKFARVVFTGGEARQTFAMSQGYLDGLDKNSGDTYGVITAVDDWSLTAGAASFPADLEGLSISVTTGDGKLQTRTIHSVASNRINIKTPWLIRPSVGDRFQIGGVHAKFMSGQFTWLDRDKETNRRLGVSFYPTKDPSTAYLRLFDDQDEEAVEFASTTMGNDYEGVGAKAGGRELSLDMQNTTRFNGYAQQRLDSRREPNLNGPRYMTFEIESIAGPDGIGIAAIDLDGVQDE